MGASARPERHALDDRDAGVLNLGGKRMLVSWFTSIASWAHDEHMMSAEEAKAAEPLFKGYTDDVIRRWLGSWLRLTDDGETWGEPIRVPVFTPHGPIRLANGDLLYLGRTGLDTGERQDGNVTALRSTDGGKTWTALGTVPLCDGTHSTNYHEPHVVELDSGRLLGMIRFQYGDGDTPSTEQLTFSLFQTESDDGGATWTPAKPTGVRGSPPHLLRHSSGAIVCVYGYRDAPYGQRAMISRDGGATWQTDLILRDDGPDWDLGYPASAEMPDGSLFTIYYQKVQAGEKCSLLWTRWALP